MPRSLIMRIPGTHFNNESLPLLSDLQSNMVAEYLFNEGAGNTLVDNSGWGRNIALTGVPTWAAEGVNFSGNGTVYAPAIALDANELTWTAVFEIDSYVNQGWGTVIGSKNYVSGQWRGLSLMTNFNSTPWRIEAYAQSGSDIYYNVPVAKQNRHFVFAAITWKAATTTLALHVPEFGYPIVKADAVVPAGTTIPAFIGTNADNAFKEKIAYAAFFSKALTEVQILAQYEIVKALMAPRGVALAAAYTL